jgi:serine/threonine-protein kinase RsbW
VSALKDSSLPSLQQASLKVGTDLTALGHVLSWFEGFASPAISQRVWLQCKTALAEGFTNAVRHAHKELSSDVPIEISVKKSPTYLEIRIFDYGQPFDLEAKLQMLPEEIDVEATGGRGLKIMSIIADRISYTRTDSHRNCLLLIKYYAD